MHKEFIPTFFYYMMEMVIFILTLQFLFTISRVDFPFMPYISWVSYVFFTAFLPLLIFSKKSTISASLNLQKMWLPMHLILMIISGILVWKFSLLALAVLVVVPYWRLVSLLKAPLHPSLLIHRFICFIGVLLFCYFYMLFTVSVVKTDTTALKESLPIFMWAQFFILLCGLLWINFITMKISSGISIRKWLKGQSLTAFIALGLVLLVVVVFLTLPFLQFIVQDLPGIVFHLLASERAFIFMDSITGLFEGKSNGVSGGEIAVNCTDCPEQDNQFKESQEDNQWIKELLLPIFQVISFLGVGGLLYMIIRKLYLIPEKQIEQSKGNLHAIKAHKENEEKRIIKWTKDEVRRLYQSLLVYIQKREETVSRSNTAREWSKRFANDQPKLWSKINQTYEQKRYSKEPLSAQDIKEYSQEIKRAKREVRHYYAKLRQRGNDRV